MSWLETEIGVKKPVIAMCHMEALPGDPDYNQEKGLSWVIERAKQDLENLQDGGVDAVMFSNESSLPYLTKVEPITYVTMARIIGELRSYIKAPFGVNVLWDATASIDLAIATGALFVREIISGAYASDFGVWNTNSGATVRHKARMGGDNIRLLYNILPESAKYLSDRDLVSVAQSTVFNCRPDALCISGLTAGAETSMEAVRQVKEVIDQTPLLVNTGVNLANLEEQLTLADGVVTGTTFKRDGYIWNEVDQVRVKAFMDKAKRVRKSKQ